MPTRNNLTTIFHPSHQTPTAPPKVMLPEGTKEVIIELAKPMDELPVLANTSASKERVGGGRLSVTTQVSTPIAAPLHTPKVLKPHALMLHHAVSLLSSI